MLWSRDRPPFLRPDAVLTRHGWADPETGELLIVLFSPNVGPGKNITQTQTGTARIFVCSQKQQLQGITHISAPSQIGKTNPTKKTIITGTSRIICPRPYNTGINPSW